MESDMNVTPDHVDRDTITVALAQIAPVLLDRGNGRGSGAPLR